MLQVVRGALCATFLLLCALPSLASAQPLRALLNQLAQTHPTIVAQYEQALASEATISEAKSGYLPRVALNATYGYQERDTTGGLTAGIKDTKPLTAGFSVSQNLFEGFRTDAAVSSATASMLATNSQYNAARQQVFLEAINAYIQLIKQQHLLQLSQHNIQTLQTQVNLEHERMMAGTGISVDVLSAKSRLQLAHERYANFLGAFHQAEASFVQFFGMQPDYRLLRLPSVNPASMPRALPQAIHIATQNNPSLQQSEHQVSAAENQRTIARSGYFPRVDVVASSNYNDTDENLSGESSTNALQLRGTWEIFSGFAEKSSETRAIHNYQATIASADHTRRSTIENTKRSWANLVTVQQRSRILQNAVSIAGQVYTARQRLRDIGSETAINVLNAENDLFSAQINAVGAQYDSYIATYRLLQAIGTLDISSVI